MTQIAKKCTFMRKPTAMFLLQAPMRTLSKGFVGPPDAVSNLRRYRYELPKNPTPLEQRLHEERMQVQQWNHDFWSKHNIEFIKLREQYVTTQLKGRPEASSLNADEMSVFYKRFLDDNWRKHFVYNFTWYKKNVNLALLHLRVKLAALGRRSLGNKRVL